MTSKCGACNKSDSETSLKRCAKCQTTHYCSKECQKSDWKKHKKICSSQAGSNPTSSASSGPRTSTPKGLETPVADPFSRLVSRTWLHDRSEKDVYTLLVDAYRFRAEDDYMTGYIEDGSLYTGAKDALVCFRRFLDRAASRPGLLPPWWTPAKRQACEELSMDASQWADLRCCVEKSDIIEQYNDAQFPMQLRMFAEQVIGTGPRGQSGAIMMQMMASMESGGDREGCESSLLDVSRV